MEHLDPKAAHQYLKDHPDAVFIDCRSEMEYMFVGQVKKIAGANFEKRPVVLICRSGNRTLEAGEALERAGFRHVMNVLHGFEGELDENHHRNSRNGWRVDGLPWEQY